MAERILAAGHPLSIYARRQEVAEELAAAGAEIAESIAELAVSVDLLIICTFSDAQLREVLFDEGALAHMQPGSILVTHVTGSPALLEEIAAQAPDGVSVLDVPVSGSAVDIAQGTLTLLVGGSEADLERARPVLESYGDPILFLGPLGTAMKIKLINNLLFAVTLRLTGEAVALGEAMGVDEHTLARALVVSSGRNFPLMGIAAGRPFAATMQGARPFMAKDVSVVNEVADELGIELGSLGKIAGVFLEKD